MAAPLKYVLVRWTSGADVDTVTIVDIKWMRGIDEFHFDGDGKPEITAIQSTAVMIE